MATMRDVAELAGVSTATVSHVINGSKKLSPETTEHVLRAISQVNYMPNTLAKSLRMGQTHTIGVLVEDIRGLPVAAIVSGISETLSKAGYKEAMKGIYTTCINKGTLDESPMAYKPMDEIIANIEPTAQIVSQIKPIYNFKAGDEE